MRLLRQYLLAMQRGSTAHFPGVGWLVGLAAAAEDGLADVAGGLGGSLERDRAPAIMKDSRVGAFGALALALLSWPLLLQGFTGDCLGATQQVCEIAVYFGLALSL